MVADPGSVLRAGLDLVGDELVLDVAFGAAARLGSLERSTFESLSPRTSWPSSEPAVSGLRRHARSFGAAIRATPSEEPSMGRMTRRTAIRSAVAGGGLLGVGATADYVLRGLLGSSREDTMMGGSSAVRVGAGSVSQGMMGGATAADMSSYMDLFTRHTELRRTVEAVPGGCAR